MSDSGVCYGTSENSLNSGMGPSESTWSFRPRGSLARTLYEKQLHDDYLSQFDKNTWYQCKLEELPQTISSKFVQLHPDEATLKFLQQSEEKSDWIFTQIWYSMVKTILGLFMSQTSINGCPTIHAHVGPPNWPFLHNSNINT